MADIQKAIIRKVLPSCYEIINEMLESATFSKELMLKARGILPSKYPQSFAGQSRKKAK